MTLWDDDGLHWHCTSSAPQLFLILFHCVKILSLYSTSFYFTELEIESWSWRLTLTQMKSFTQLKKSTRYNIWWIDYFRAKIIMCLYDNTTFHFVRSKIFRVKKRFTFHNWLHHQIYFVCLLFTVHCISRTEWMNK